MPRGIYLHKKGYHLSEETRRRMSKAHQGKPSGMLGKRPSEEHRRKISEAKKGKIPKNFWMLHTPEVIKKISEALKGDRNPMKKLEVRKKISEALKGRKLSEETRKKISKFLKGKKLSEDTKRKLSEIMKRKKIIPWNKGKYLSKEIKKKMSEAHKGERAPAWKGGVTPINKRIRQGLEFRLWRKAIFERDNFTCQRCKQKGGRLHPHHIFNFADYPEMRFAIDNGITLCDRCHNEFHKKYGKKNNTKEQLEEFFKPEKAAELLKRELQQ